MKIANSFIHFGTNAKCRYGLCRCVKCRGAADEAEGKKSNSN